MLWYVDYTRGYVGRLNLQTKKVDEKDRIWISEAGKQLNRLVGFDPRSATCFSNTEIPGELNTVRHMVFDKKSKLLWYGSDAGKIGAGGGEWEQGGDVGRAAPSGRRRCFP